MNQQQNKKPNSSDSNVKVQIIATAGVIIVAIVTGVFGLLGESPTDPKPPTCNPRIYDSIHEHGIDRHYYQLDTFFYSLDCITVQDTAAFVSFKQVKYFQALDSLKKKNKVPHSIDLYYFIKHSKDVVFTGGQPRVRIPGFNNLIAVFKDGIKKDSNGMMAYYIITRIPKRARDLYPSPYEDLYKIINENLEGGEHDLDSIYELISKDERIKQKITAIAVQYKLYLFLIKDYLFLQLADMMDSPKIKDFPKAEYEFTQEQEFALRFLISALEKKLEAPYNKDKKFTILCKGSSSPEPVQNSISYNMPGCWDQDSTPVYLGQKHKCQPIGQYIQPIAKDKDGNLQLSYARAYSGITYLQENLFSSSDSRAEKLKKISFAYQGLGVKDRRTIVITLIEQ